MLTPSTFLFLLTGVVNLDISPGDQSEVRLALFFYENLVSTAREFSRKCETPRCENSTLAINLVELWEVYA